MATDAAIITTMTDIECGVSNVTPGAPSWSPTSEFDDFLSASIGQERNGLLSVVSMLGRLNIDPWQEAAQLANLPRSAATNRLASLIESIPDRMASEPDPRTIAAHLVSRLPHRTAPPASQGILAEATGRMVISNPWMLLMAIALVTLVGFEFLSASQAPSPKQPAVEAERP
jgi:hypothetical protein